MHLLLLLLLAPQDAVEFDAVQPQVAIAPDGTVHVVMVKDKNIMVASSKDGRKFDEAVVAIDARGKAGGGRRRGPRIGVDKKGNLVVTAPVCFDEAEFKNRYPKSEIVLVRSSDKGKTWTKPIQVNDVPKKAAEALHWMAVAPNGDAHVAWLDHRAGKANCLWYAKVTGTKPSKDRQLTGEVCPCCAPGLALDGKGNPIVTVRDNSKTNKTVLLLISKNAGKSFSKAKPINAAPTGVAG